MPSNSKSSTNGTIEQRATEPPDPAAAIFNIARVLSASALLLASMSTLASLPGFEIGHWEKAEPIVIIVHIAGAFAFAALAALGAADASRLIAVLLHPFVLIPAAIAIWSLAAIPTATYPMAVILGPPQSGQGTLWYMTLAALTACARLVRVDREMWFWISTAVIVIATAVAGLRLWAAVTGAPHLLLGVGGFYAYIALALPLLAVPLQGRRRVGIAVAGAATAVAVLAASLNLSAIVAAGLGTVLAGCLFAWQRRRGAEPISRTPGAVAVSLAAFVPYIALKWLDISPDFPSLLSRHLTIRVVEASAATAPVQIIVGHGLGHTQDALFANVGVAGVKLWESQWDFIWRDYFHSHNWLVEAIFTMGFPGAALVFVALLAPALWVKADLRPVAIGFAAATALLDGLWFPLGFYLPYLALAWAALAAPVESLPRHAAPLNVRALMVSLSAGLAIITLSAATSLGVFAAKVSPLKDSLSAMQIPAPTSNMPKSPHGTDTALAQIAQNTLEKLARLPIHQRNESARDRFRWIVQNLSAAIPTTRTPVLVMSGLSLLAMTDVTKELAWLSLPPATHDRLWAEWAGRIFRLAPNRTDVLIPYLSHLLVSGRPDQVSVQARKILSIRRRDPVGLYFLGAAFTADTAVERKMLGLGLIRQALAAGIEQFMPIPESLRKDIESTIPAPTGQQ